MDHEMIDLTRRPELAGRAAAWFHDKWDIPQEAYRESMEDSFRGRGAVPRWYLVLAGEHIVAGAGIIENDFHDRKDLAPNLCALYVEPDCRCQGIAGALLGHIAADMKIRGVDPLYLITDHTSFYERYGWEFLCMVQPEEEPDPMRMYIHRES